MSERGAAFARAWIAQNVQIRPDEDVKTAVEMLCLNLSFDAIVADISTQEIEEELGEYEVFMADAYRQALDGGKLTA